MNEMNEGRRLFEERRTHALADPKIRAFYEDARAAFEAAADDYAAATTLNRADVIAAAISLTTSLRLTETLRQIAAILDKGRPPQRSRVAWSKRKHKRARRRV